MIPAIYQLLTDYNKKPYAQHLRLGQYFMNVYIRSDAALDAQNLYYERDQHRAEAVIAEWLIQHDYINELPREAQDE